MYAALGVTAAMTAALASPADAARMSSRDTLILNFALQLEYLEAEFYLFARTGVGLTPEDTSGRGTAGATTGGSLVAMPTDGIRATATELAVDETAHVRLLRTALGGRRVAKPAINLNALNVGFGNESEFLLLGRAFEDEGVSAYGGAAGLITSKSLLRTAARILATEAYHAGNIRYQVATRGLSGLDNPVDDQDQIAALDNLIPTDSSGLSIVRTPPETSTGMPTARQMARTTAWLTGRFSFAPSRSTTCRRGAPRASHLRAISMGSP